MLADGLTEVLPGPALFDMRDKHHLVDVGPPPRDAYGGVPWHACMSGGGALVALVRQRRTAVVCSRV